MATKGSEGDKASNFMKHAIPLCCEAVIPITAKLLKKQKEVKEIDAEMEVQRAEFNTRMRKVQKRRDEIKRKEALIMKALKEFEEFAQEKARKKNEVESSYFKETKVVAEIDKELHKLKLERERLVKKKHNLENSLKKYLPCQQFLESVVNASHQFENVYDLIAYYDTLSFINKELVELENRELEAIDIEKQKTIIYKMEQESQILANRNRVIELQRERESWLDKVLAADCRYHEVEQVNKIRTTEAGQITMAIASMYMTVCSFEKIAPKHSNPIRQMEKVKEFIEDWSEVAAESKELEERKKDF